MKKLLLLFVGTTVLFAFSGCAKDEDPSPTPKKTNEEILVSTPWRLSAMTVSPAYDWNGDGNLITNIYGQFPACYTDDFDTYNANKTYLTDEGATKCDPSDPQTFGGIWSMNSNQTQLILDGDVMMIKSMSETQMTWETTFVEDGTTYTATATYSKK